MPDKTDKRIDLVKRWDGNPLLTVDDLAFACTNIWSSGMATFKGERVLLVTVEHLEGHHAIHMARHRGGDRFDVDEVPFIGKEAPHAMYGVSDPKVTRMDGTYYVMYLANGEYGYRLGLVATRDFTKIESKHLVSAVGTRAGALFPERINGRYARLERSKPGNGVWISYSDDLNYWGNSDLVLGPRGNFWDRNKVGVAAPPMRVSQGWLFIYYGVRMTSAGPLYRLGAAILDPGDPRKVVGRCRTPLLSARDERERIGDLPNSVFASGATIEDGTISLLYNGADSGLCIGTITVAEVVDACNASGEGR